MNKSAIPRLGLNLGRERERLRDKAAFHNDPETTEIALDLVANRRCAIDTETMLELDFDPVPTGFRSGDATTRRRASTTVCYEVILGQARAVTGGGIVAALMALGPARAARARYAHSLGTACAL